MKPTSLIRQLGAGLLMAALLLRTATCWAADPLDVTSQLTLTTANEQTTLDRATRQLTSTADLTIANASQQAVMGPLHAVIDITSANSSQVQMPTAQGGIGAQPYNTYYFIPSLTQNTLGAGQSVKISLKFVRPSGVTLAYRVRVLSLYTPTTTTHHPPQLNLDKLSYDVQEGGSLSIPMTASDPDGDVVTISAAPLLTDASFASSPAKAASATFGWTPPYGQRGTHLVTFTARDLTGLTDVKVAQINVGRVNRPPTLDVPSSATVTVGQLLKVPVTASDPDGDLVRVTAAPLPSNSIFSPTAGSIAFAPDKTQIGEFQVTCQASDGQLSSGLKTVTLRVVDAAAGGTSETAGLSLFVNQVASPTLLAKQRITGTVTISDQGVASSTVWSSALINGMQPAQGEQGASVDVTLTGMSSGSWATHFIDGTSVASFGDGITVTALKVNSAQEAVATIKIQPGADIGTRQVSVVTGTETAVSLLAFNVIRGKAGVTGRLVDATSGDPIAGALVTLEGTGLTIQTLSDGRFSFLDAPAGSGTLLLNPPDHALVSMNINLPVGGTIDLGDIQTASTVFDPTAPPAATAQSVTARLAKADTGQLTIEEAKQLVIDAITLAGGDEIGALDAYGNQLSPNVTGSGLVSLTNDSIEGYAERLAVGKSVRLMDVLFALSFSYEWSNGRPSLDQWIAGLQKVVNKAWQYPSDPDSQLPIMLFNSGSILTPDAPQITASTRLTDFQAFMLIGAFMNSYEMFHVEKVGPPNGIGNNPLVYRHSEPKLLAMASAVDGISPAAHESPGDPSNFGYYVSQEVGTAQTFVSGLGLTGMLMAPMVPYMMGGQLAMVQGTQMQQFGNIMTESYIDSVCGPPTFISAEVRNAGTPIQSVWIRFHRSNADPGVSFGGTDQAGVDTRGRRYAYVLYRETYKRGGVTLDPISSTPVPSDDNETLYLSDTFPKAGINHYRILFSHGSWNMDMSYLMRQVGLSTADLYHWTGHSLPVGPNADYIPVDAFYRMMHCNNQLTSRLNNAPIGVEVPNTGGASNPVVDLEVDAVNARVMLGDRDKDVINIVHPIEGTSATLWTETGFKAPGQVGLAADGKGNLYSLNANSQEQFGGRIFRFDKDKNRVHSGQVNYYSQQINVAHVSDVVAMTCNPAGDLYVADNYDRMVKLVPTSATYDPYRRVGQPVGEAPAEGFSTFTDLCYVPDHGLFVTMNQYLYEKRDSDGYWGMQSTLPGAIFAGLGADPRKQLYIACQGVSGVGKQTGFLMVLPNAAPGGESFTSAEGAAPFIFLRGLTYPSDIEVSADGRAIFYVESGRPRSQYFGISGQILDQYGQPWLETNGATKVKVDTDLGESPWVGLDQNSVFSIMGLLAPGQKFDGDSKLITMTIKTEKSTDERQVRLYAKGQTVMKAAYNPYDIIMNPIETRLAVQKTREVTYKVIDRETKADVTHDVYSKGMIDLTKGDAALVDILDPVEGKFTVKLLAEPGDEGTYAAVSVHHPTTGKRIADGFTNIYGAAYTLKSNPAGPEIKTPRGKTKRMAVEVYDLEDNRVTDLDALAGKGYTLKHAIDAGGAGAPQMGVTEIATDKIDVKPADETAEDTTYTLTWSLEWNGKSVAKSDPVKLIVSGIEVTKSVTLDDNDPKPGKAVHYKIVVKNNHGLAVTGRLDDTIPSELKIESTSENVSVVGQYAGIQSLPIGADSSAEATIECRIKDDAELKKVSNTAKFVIGGVTKPSTVDFDMSKITLDRTGKATMKVRGVTPGCKLSKCVPGKLYPPYMTCKSPSPDDPIKTVEIDKAMVTLYGTTELELTAELFAGDETDTVNFTSDIQSSSIHFSTPQVNGRKIKTTLKVIDLWNAAGIDRENPPVKMTVTVGSLKHGAASYEVNIIDNYKKLIDLYHDNWFVDKYFGDGFTSNVEWLNNNHMKPIAMIEGIVVKYFLGMNKTVCTQYQSEVLTLFNDLRSRGDTIWLFNGLDYGPLQTETGWDNVCCQKSAGHYCVSLYPPGFFQSSHDRVLDGWIHQQPVVWRYDDWAWFWQRHTPVQGLRFPGACEYGQNYPNSKYFDPSFGYPAWNEYASGAVQAYDPEKTTRHLANNSGLILLSPLNFVVTDSQGRRYGKDGDGNEYNEIPGFEQSLQSFDEDTGDQGTILNHALRDFNLRLYPTKDGEASMIILRILSDGTAQNSCFDHFPIKVGQPLDYSPLPDQAEPPKLQLGDGTLKAPDKVSSIFTVTATAPLEQEQVASPYPAISARLSKPIDPDAKLLPDSFTLRMAHDPAVIPTTTVYDATTRTLKMTSHAPLISGMTYCVTLNLKQVPLVDDQLDDFQYQWLFTTQSQ